MPILHARYKWESAYPELWPDYGWCPSINPYGVVDLYDRGGNCRHGVLTNFNLSTAWANPAVNGLVFDGTNDYVPTSVVDISGPLSVVAWVYPTSVTGFRCIVANDNSTAVETQLYFGVGTVFNSNCLSVGCYSHTGAYRVFGSPNNSISANTAYCLGMSNDGLNTSTSVKLFINGQPVTVSHVSAGGPANAVGYGTLTIGREGDYNGNYYVGGILGVQISRRILTPGDFATLNALGPAGIYTPADRPVFGQVSTGNRRRRVIIGAA